MQPRVCEDCSAYSHQEAVDEQVFPKIQNARVNFFHKRMNSKVAGIFQSKALEEEMFKVMTKDVHKA